MAYLRARLAEASSWAGIGAALVGGAMLLNGPIHDGLILASVAAGVIGVLVQDQRS